MGCCLCKYYVHDSESQSNGKPEILLLTSAEDDTAHNHSSQISPDTEHLSTLVALYDYASRNAQDLSFKKGDELILESKEVQGWWLVTHTITGEKGYVPKNFIAVARTLHSEKWFFGTITRKDSEQLLLKAKKKGCFLIRESETSENSYSLSLLNEDEKKGAYAKHYRIRCDGKNTLYITENLKFDNLPALVKYYHDDPHGLCCQLVEPCPIRETPQTYSLAPKLFNLEEGQIKSLEEIEIDSSGVMHRALWNDSLAVAVKRYSSEANPSAPDTLKKLHHKTIVKYFGSISSDRLSICWEYLSGGTLSTYLKDPSNAGLALVDLIDIAAQVSTGMAYLEDSNIPHKCLRARHIMVGEGRVFKVTDYSVYGLPLKTDSDTALWMSPEAIKSSNHDLKSDIWSFGVFTMEVITKCERPAWEAGESSSDLLDKHLTGHRMPRHNRCPETLYELLLQCWDKERDLRPTFEYIQIFLESFFQRTDLFDPNTGSGSKPDGLGNALRT